jgi:SAM-dependent methyltransferase
MARQEIPDSNRKEQSPETYDEMFQTGGFGGVFDLPYKASTYLPLFKYVLAELKRAKVGSILEVGCGTGAFAHLLHDRSNIEYRGFDFSGEGVSRACKRLGQDDIFFIGDARDPDNYAGDYDAIVCTEVLEHVIEDTSVVDLWPKGIPIIASVPNFDSDTHERFFRTEDEVRKRYGSAIEIEKMTKIKHPVLTDISLNNRLRALRWKRNDPQAMLEILGFGSFEDVGGWFVFTGRKK